MFGKEEPQGGWRHRTVLQLGLPWGQNREIKEEKQQQQEIQHSTDFLKFYFPLQSACYYFIFQVLSELWS